MTGRPGLGRGVAEVTVERLQCPSTRTCDLDASHGAAACCTGRAGARLGPVRTLLVTRVRLGGLVCSVFTVVTALAGCSSGGGRDVFQVFDPSPDGMLATTVDVVDVGLDLTNVAGSTVTLQAVTLVSVPQAVHLRSVTAYGPDALPVGLVHGDLLRYCGKTDKPHPVTVDVTRPHSDSPWNLVLAVTFKRPGTYHLTRAKIFYRTGGHTGWQYQDLNTTISVTAAGNGTKPRLDGC